MTTLERLQTAVAEGRLLHAAAENLRTWLGGDFLPDWARAALAELVERGEWAELNDRFYRTLEFGTGGMRGRTIGRVSAAAELGEPGPQGTPAHPAVGCNVLNDFTVARATVGLYRYAAAHLAARGRGDVPKLVIAHDVRHFSRHFCELAAATWTRLGGVACIFDGPRSTPQLSFSVRYLQATCGVVITASHNPPHDNGYKVYFEDGGQVVAPHDKGIIAEVNRVEWAEAARHLDPRATGVVTLGPAADEDYRAVLQRVVIDPKVFAAAKLKVVFTSIHGTGGIASVPLLRHFGIAVVEQPEQTVADPRFPTVKSPNPENAEALALAVKLAAKLKADLVLATDPDADRVGVAVRTRTGELRLLTGNQVGAILAEYRIAKFKQLGWLPKNGTKRAALIKTFVTSRLQDAIGASHGLKVVNTLTGFKWIADKIHDYEKQLLAALREKEGLGLDYDATDYATRARLLRKHSTFYVFGDEESYGYLPTDDVRDKDGNAACLVFCELAAAVKKSGKTVEQYLDGLYRKYGFYTEAVGQIYYEGAAGSAKIARILETYRAAPPREMDGVAVTKFTDFGRETIVDPDGKRIPPQDLYFVDLANGFSYAVRGSGTEPKIKFYLFAHAKVRSAAALPKVKTATQSALDRLRDAVEADAARRAES